MDKNAMQIRRENWRRILLECYASGLSKKQWCKENGIRSRKLYYWQKIVREEELKELEAARDGQNPLEEGTPFLFCGRNRSRLKGLIYEEGGYCMITKRLSEGKFQWPRNSDEARTLTMEQFALLMRGFTLEGRITARG